MERGRTLGIMTIRNAACGAAAAPLWRAVMWTMVCVVDVWWWWLRFGWKGFRRERWREGVFVNLCCLFGWRRVFCFVDGEGWMVRGVANLGEVDFAMDNLRY